MRRRQLFATLAALLSLGLLAGCPPGPRRREPAAPPSRRRSGGGYRY